MNNELYPAHEDLENWYYQKTLGRSAPKFDNSFLIEEFQSLLTSQQQDRDLIKELAAMLLRFNDSAGVFGYTPLVKHSEALSIDNLIQKANQRLKEQE